MEGGKHEQYNGGAKARQRTETGRKEENRLKRTCGIERRVVEG